MSRISSTTARRSPAYQAPTRINSVTITADERLRMPGGSAAGDLVVLLPLATSRGVLTNHWRNPNPAIRNGYIGMSGCACVLTGRSTGNKLASSPAGNVITARTMIGMTVEGLNAVTNAVAKAATIQISRTLSITRFTTSRTYACEAEACTSSSDSDR